MEEMQLLQQAQKSEGQREDEGHDNDYDSGSEMEQGGPSVTEGHYKDGSDEGTDFLLPE